MSELPAQSTSTAAPESSESHPFPLVPAPWKAKGEIFTLLHKSPTDFRGGKGGYSGLEESTLTNKETSGSFVPNTLGTVMVARYTEGNGGAYDELLFCPGAFTVPQFPGSTNKEKLQQKLRITNIYVSSLTSVYNGRRNWNTPKHLAQFKFTPEEFHLDPNCKSVSVEVRPCQVPSATSSASASNTEPPFFKAEFQIINYHPTLPGWLLNTNYFPPKSLFDLTLYLPPLPQSPNWQENGEVGTDRWRTCFGGFNAKAGVKGVWAMPGLEVDGTGSEEEQIEGGGEEHNSTNKNKQEKKEIKRFGDGVNFPEVDLWKYGLWYRGVEFMFPESEDVERGEDKKKK